MTVRGWTLSSPSTNRSLGWGRTPGNIEVCLKSNTNPTCLIWLRSMIINRRVIPRATGLLRQLTLERCHAGGLYLVFFRRQPTLIQALQPAHQIWRLLPGPSRSARPRLPHRSHRNGNRDNWRLHLLGGSVPKLPSQRSWSRIYVLMRRSVTWNG